MRRSPGQSPRRRFRLRRLSRRGAAIIWLVALLPVLIGMAGLAIDTAWRNHVGDQLQSAADASALAAARLVKSDQAGSRSAAVLIASLNEIAGSGLLLDSNSANAAGGDVVLGNFDRTTGVFTPTTAAPNAVRVTARRTNGSENGALPLIFGAAMGVPSVQLERSAIAMVSGGSGAGVITLAPTGSCSFDIGGNGVLTVNLGSIHVNSGDDCAMCGYGSADLVTESVDVVGEACTWGAFNMDGTISNGAASIDDPLQWLPAPAPGPTQPNVANGGNVTIQPGYYPNGINRTGGTLTCQPGVYFLDGPASGCSSGGLRVSGNSTIIAEGCIFYINRGPISLQGTGTLQLTPPDSGTYEFITFFQARDNTCTAAIRGNSQTTVAGTIYLPAAHLDLRGNGTVTGFEHIVAWTMAVSGSGDLTIDYHGQFPAGTPTAYLVD